MSQNTESVLNLSIHLRVSGSFEANVFILQRHKLLGAMKFKTRLLCFILISLFIAEKIILSKKKLESLNKENKSTTSLLKRIKFFLIINFINNLL
jgi:hypothetical protein